MYMPESFVLQIQPRIILSTYFWWEAAQPLSKTTEVKIRHLRSSSGSLIMNIHNLYPATRLQRKRRQQSPIKENIVEPFHLSAKLISQHHDKTSTLTCRLPSPIFTGLKVVKGAEFGLGVFRPRSNLRHCGFERKQHV